MNSSYFVNVYYQNFYLKKSGFLNVFGPTFGFKGCGTGYRGEP